MLCDGSVEIAILLRGGGGCRREGACGERGRLDLVGAVGREEDARTGDGGVKVLDAAIGQSGSSVSFAAHSPVDVAIVLPTRRELSGQFDARKVALLSMDGSHEADGASHAAGHRHDVAHIERSVIGHGGDLFTGSGGVFGTGSLEAGVGVYATRAGTTDLSAKLRDVVDGARAGRRGSQQDTRRQGSRGLCRSQRAARDIDRWKVGWLNKLGGLASVELLKRC